MIQHSRVLLLIYYYNCLIHFDFQELRKDLLENASLPDKEKKKALDGLAKDFPSGIPKCGADALRLGLLNDEIKVQQVNLDPKVITANRNFCNKLWQAVRLYKISKDKHPGVSGLTDDPSSLCVSSDLSLEDEWVLHQCACAVEQANASLESFDFHLAIRAMLNFVKSDLCDVYLEAIKPHLHKEQTTESVKVKMRVLHLCLVTALKLIHPVMPFITEELYHHVGHTNPTTVGSIMVQSYPTSSQV